MTACADIISERLGLEVDALSCETPGSGDDLRRGWAASDHDQPRLFGASDSCAHDSYRCRET